MNFPYAILIAAIIGILNTIHVLSLSKSNQSSTLTTESTDQKPVSLGEIIQFASMTISNTIYAIVLYMLYTESTGTNTFIV